MHEKLKIDILAHVSKEVVESLYIEKHKKDAWKLGIDGTAEALKLYVDLQQAHIEKIRISAFRHNLDRVVLFPCAVNGSELLFLRMYGGAVAEFCAELGIQQIQSDSLKVNPIYLDTMEHQHGIVLYDRNRQ